METKNNEPKETVIRRALQVIAELRANDSVTTYVLYQSAITALQKLAAECAANGTLEPNRALRLIHIMFLLKDDLRTLRLGECDASLYSEILDEIELAEEGAQDAPTSEEAEAIVTDALVSIAGRDTDSDRAFHGLD